MSNRINRALESLDFMQYKNNFIESELEDELLDDCIANGSITAVLSGVISVLGHRLKFIKKFSSYPNEEIPSATPPSQNVTEDDNAQVSSVEPIEVSDDDIEDANQEFEHPEEPRPVQIMDFKRKRKMDSPAKVICYEKALASILKRTGNRRVAVLAIAGATRKGKSVFLNFVLRRLVGLQNDEIDWMGWARKTEPLTGFSWDASDERVTAGIWMWSEPFTLKSKKDGTEFDILLMDTQGVYDDQSGHREWSILMGLSLLTSSCLIFNIVHNIDEKDLLLLDEFLSFGLMALDKNVGLESQSAFQKLVFLIRDWNSPSTFPYGSEGGKKLIEKKLGTKGLRDASHIAVREKLKKCFQEISCFLLPHPGPDAIEMNFNGSIASCAKFADQVEKSIAELLDNKEFPIKNINGNPLTGQDFLALFKLYVGLFNNESMLSSEAIYNATSQGCNSAVVNKCVSFFTVELGKKRKGSSFLLDTVLEEHQEAAQKKALTLFEDSRKMGTQSVINEAYNDLRERLMSVFEEIKSKNLEIRTEAISRAHSDALLKYSKLVEEALATAGEFMNEDNLKGVSDTAKIRSLQLFHSLLQLNDSGDLMDEKEMVCQSIQDRMEQYQRENEDRKNEAEKKLEEEVLTLVEAYVNDMDSKVGGQYLSDEALQSYHAIAFKQSVDDFDKIHSTSLLYEKGLETLIKKIGVEQENLQQVMNTAYEGIQNEGESLIAKALDSYRENMMHRIGFDGELFEKSHRIVKASSMEILTRSEKIPNEKFMGKFVYELESKLHDVHVELLQILHQNKMRIEKEINKAKEDTRKNYEGAMRAFFDQREDPVLEPKLEARHNHERSLANSSLKSFYERMMNNLKNGEEQKIAGLAELAETIKDIYTKFQTINKLRWQAFESRGYNYLAKVKERYAKMLKNAVDTTSAREELAKENAAIIIVVETVLVEKLDPNVAKPEFVEKLVDELRDYIKVTFEESLKLFQFRLEEGLAVQAALYEAKQYYNQEMEKVFYAKDWLQTDELLLLNDNLTEAAIRKCKDDITLTENQEKQLLEAMKIVYLKYEEENSRRYPAENPSIGIDLGTTYSCVGVYINGKVKIIPNRDYDESGTTASYVAFNQDGTIDVGQTAKEQAFLNPVNTIFDAKRLIGRTYNDKIVQQDIKLWPFNVVSDNDKPLIEVHGRRYRPEEISAKILAKLKQIAENYLNKTVKQAVVTVPAYFNDGQRQATRDAAAIAGLKVRILNEPTAAAIAYRLHRTDELKRNVLIFDLGGGTFDVAVLEMKGGEIKVKATGGDTHLGGEDFDNAMVNRIIEKVKTKNGIDLARGRNSIEQFNKFKASERLRRIRDRCETAKRNLSSTSSTVVNIDRIDENFDLNERFTRKEFEDLNLALFQKCIEIVKKTLEDAKMPKADIDDIVLVGGSTRIPKVQELLKAFFDGKKELSSTINANEAVACGAAIQAALLNGEQATSVDHDVVLTDVAPLSLGIEIVTGEMSKVIHKNSAVPCSYTEVFRTVVNNQTTVNFKVYEGEEQMASDNNCLGKFLLTGIPSAPAGKEPIDCTMRIDSEGILHVKAVSRNNGQESDIMIETYNGRMTHEEIGAARLEELLRW